MVTKRKSTVDDALARAVNYFGFEARLAKAAGISQQSLNRAIKRGRVSPELAIGIQRATHGKVTADQLRPDIWSHSRHVPLPRNGRRA